VRRLCVVDAESGVTQQGEDVVVAKEALLTGEEVVDGIGVSDLGKMRPWVLDVPRLERVEDHGRSGIGHGRH